MIRIAISLCFSLTLLCPVFCLAEADGDCSDHGRSSGKNCEAMSVGAVVVKSETGTTQFVPLPSVAEPFLSAESFAVVSHPWLQLEAWNRASTKPPPAATRQALLQMFLF